MKREKKGNASDQMVDKWGTFSHIIIQTICIRPDQFNFREHRFFQNLKGRSVVKKRKIEKNPQFFVLALIINNNFL